MTVEYNEDLNLWVTFGLNFLSYDIQLYTAENITGITLLIFFDSLKTLLSECLSPLGPYIVYPTPVYTVPPPFSTIPGILKNSLKRSWESFY